MPAPKIALELSSLRRPLKQALPVAARLGAQAVELNARTELRPQDMTDTAIRQIRKLYSDLELKVCALSFRTRRGYNDQREIDARVGATKQAMLMAPRLGANIVVNHIGRIPDSEDDPEWSLLLDVLNDLGAYGTRVGALLAAEAGINSGEQLARLFAALPEGTIAATLNPGALVASGHSPISAVHALGDSLMHVYANDGTREISSGRGLTVPLGRGLVDYPELLGTLEERDYRGYLTINCEGAEDPLSADDAISYLRSLY